MMLNRRKLLKSAAATVIASSSMVQADSLIQPGCKKKKTFVLIHGAWHGGWCWKFVADKLRALGHEVFTPSLTGLAEHSHLLDTSINLSTHIHDIVNLIKWESLNNIVLVAHSYGGWPISGALEHIHDKVKSVIFVDSFLPEDGQCVIDFNSAQFQLDLLESVARKAPGRPVPDAKLFGILDAKNRRWVQEKMTQQPTGVAIEPIKLTGKRDQIAKKSYIRAAGYNSPQFDKFYEQCKEIESWNTFSFASGESGHDIMIDAPLKLTNLLLKYS